MGWLKTAWSVGSKIPSLLSGGAGIWIRLGLIAAALTAASGWGFVKGIEHGADQRAAVQVNLGRCQDGQAALKAAISHQNGAIEALRADMARRAQEAAGAVQAAQAAKVAAQAEASRLRNLQGSPQAKEGACPAAAALEVIRSGLK